ncbi:MAG TPA: hypothetical protein VN901_05410 [Candidatus Acidoferrales bacterium]|nr:hypothetical protein [Candidatus Acidoferrales bacterium]
MEKPSWDFSVARAVNRAAEGFSHFASKFSALDPTSPFVDRETSRAVANPQSGRFDARPWEGLSV